MSNLKTEAKMEALEEITKKVAESAGEGEQIDGMLNFAIGVQSMMAIDIYDKILTEKIGDFGSLLTAIENGEFRDNNGTLLTDTLTFQNLKKKLANES